MAIDPGEFCTVNDLEKLEHRLGNGMYRDRKRIADLEDRMDRRDADDSWCAAHEDAETQFADECREPSTLAHSRPIPKYESIIREAAERAINECAKAGGDSELRYRDLEEVLVMEVRAISSQPTWQPARMGLTTRV